jgi:hypothetical protein
MNASFQKILPVSERPQTTQSRVEPIIGPPFPSNADGSRVFWVGFNCEIAAIAMRSNETISQPDSGKITSGYTPWNLIAPPPNVTALRKSKPSLRE